MKTTIAILVLFIVATVNISLLAQEKTTDSRLAAKYYSDKQYDKAVVYYERLYNELGSRVYFNSYFDCLLKLEDYKKAEKIVKKQISHNKTDLTYYVDYGRIYKQQGDKSKADKKYLEAIENIEGSEFQAVALANTFIKERELELAEKTYLQARKKMSVYPFYEELAVIYGYQRNYDKMVIEFLDYLEISPEKLDLVQARLQNMIVSETDDQLRKILKTKLLERIQKNDKVLSHNELLIWLFIQEKNFKAAYLQVKALDRRFGESGKRVLDFAELALSNNFYDVAIEAYNYVAEKGQQSKYYFQARIGVLDVYYKKVINGQINSNNDVIDLENNYKATIDFLGKNRNSVKILKDLAHLQAYYLSKPQDAINLLNESITISGLSIKIIAELKIELADVYLLIDEIWDATLTYAQVEEDFKHEPIGHEAKFRKARLAYYTGDFLWAQAQLDVLKASTSKLIANDAFELALMISDNTALDTTEIPLQLFASADLLILQNKDSAAVILLDSISKSFSEHSLADDILMKKANIARKKFQYDKEIEFLNSIVDNFNTDILADNALFRLAEIHEQVFADKEKAMMYYKKLMTDYSNSILVTEARKRFRLLRGDKPDKTDDFQDENLMHSF